MFIITIIDGAAEDIVGSGAALRSKKPEHRASTL